MIGSDPSRLLFHKIKFKFYRGGFLLWFFTFLLALLEALQISVLALWHTQNILCHWAHVTLVLNHVCICSDPSFNFNGFVLILGRWSLDCTNEPFDQAIFITRFLLSDPTMQRRPRRQIRRCDDREPATATLQRPQRPAKLLKPHYGVDRENSVHLVLAVGLMAFIDSRSRWS